MIIFIIFIFLHYFLCTKYMFLPARVPLPEISNVGSWVVWPWDFQGPFELQHFVKGCKTVIFDFVTANEVIVLFQKTWSFFLAYIHEEKNMHELHFWEIFSMWTRQHHMLDWCVCYTSYLFKTGCACSKDMTRNQHKKLV